MKRTALALTLLFLTFNGFAQDEELPELKISFGIKAGLNSVHMKTVSDMGDQIQKNSGVYVGAFLNIPTSDIFSVQPEVIYSSTKYLSRSNMKLLHVPVLLNFKLANNFTGFVGPEAQFLIDLGDSPNQDLFNSVMFGFTFGANYKITPNFYIEARPYFAY